MTELERRNRSFLADLFAGSFRGHAVIMDAPGVPCKELGDFAISERPVADWVPVYVRRYEERVRFLEAIGDDSVPYANLNTNTGVFAAAFGCPIHVYAEETNAAARPVVRTAREADALPEPSLGARTVSRIFELGRLMRRELGPEAPIGVPDIQSPFDIAALVWNKEDFLVALLEEPEAVRRLVGKCLRLLTGFLTEFKREFPECNLCHCPNAWAPPRLGAWLSEDEVGSLSPAMFEEFCLPALVELSETFGGLFMHCCASAEHQFPGFLRIPDLRGLNRAGGQFEPMFRRRPGAAAPGEAFAGETVFMVAWTAEQEVNMLLDIAPSGSRFLINMPEMPLDEAKAVFERLRRRCPREDPVAAAGAQARRHD